MEKKTIYGVNGKDLVTATNNLEGFRSLDKSDQLRIQAFVKHSNPIPFITGSKKWTSNPKAKEKLLNRLSDVGIDTLDNMSDYEFEVWIDSLPPEESIELWELGNS